MYCGKTRTMTLSIAIVMGLWTASSAVAAPINDDCFNAIELIANEPYYGSTLDATGGDTEGCEGWNDVWFRFTLLQERLVRVALNEYDFFDSTLSVHSECGGWYPACANSTAGWGEDIVFEGQAGQTYWIRVAGVWGMTGDFVLTVMAPEPIQPTLTLESPFGGEQWLEGMIHRISWQTTGTVETVRLEFSSDGGNQWTDIVTVANIGFYEWLVPPAHSDRCLIRISNAADPTITDTSDSPFRIGVGTCDTILQYARSRLFERTISGLRAAYAALDVVLSRSDCAGSARLREARFLHAATRITMLAVADDSVEPQSAVEVARLFGLELIGDLLNEVDFTYPTNNHDYYEVPAGAPKWDQIKQILETTTVAEIDAIVAELNLVTETQANPFSIRFTPQETGRSKDLEVDFAEVLILKSALKWAKGLILAESAYDLNMTEEDQELLAQKIYGDTVSINQDILNKYPNLLKVLPTPGHPENGKTMLANARSSIVEAIGDILAAMSYMESETDPQNDDLLYIDSSNLREVNIVRQRLNTLRNSLSTNTSAVYTFDEEREYRLTDPSKPGRIWTLDLGGYDPFERPTEGEFWTSDPDFPGSWEVTSADYEGNNFLLEMEYTWGFGGGTLEGTFNADKTRITTAVFDYWVSWMGQGNLVNLSGQQTEVSTNRVEFNLNPLFNATVSPRNMLPTFTDWNWVLPNTMGAGLGNSATLGGVLPGMTHADWNDAFDARLASGYPTGTIEGTVQFDQWINEPIYIEAYHNPGDSENSVLSQTMISQPGNYVLKGISPGHTVYVRAYVPLFGFKIFELSAFEIESRVKIPLTSNRTAGVNLSLQRPTRLDNGDWYVGVLDSELALRRYYSFEAKKGGMYSFQLDRSNLPGAMILIYSRNAKTELVERSEWEPQEIVDWICPVDGTYYVKVHVPEWTPWMTYNGTYRIRMITPSPDINQDGCVTLEDLALVSGHWLDFDCEIGNDFCGGADLDHNSRIDLIDYSMYSANWLRCFQPVTRGLISQWTMDDRAAGPTVTDSSVNHFSGTARQNTAVLTTPGTIGTALAFNGTTDWIDCGTNAALLPDAWTISAWVKCSDLATPLLISFGGNYPSVKLQNNGKGKPLIHLGANNYRYFAGSAWTTLKDGQWHHVAFSVPGKGQADIESAKMYLDSMAVAGDAPVTTGPQTDKSHLYLGANPSAGTQRFGGVMDHVMLFNRALSSQEIRTLFVSETPNGLVTHWTMDDNAANPVVSDAGDNHFDGTAQQNTAILTTAGKLNSALSFNGTTDYVDCGTNVAMLPDAWTVCAWVKCADAATPILLSFGGNYSSIKLQNNANGKPLIHLGKTNYRYFTASAWTLLKDGQWHHVAFSAPGKEQMDIEQAKMYLDGAAVAGDPAVTTGLQNDKSHVYLGANPSAAAHRFSGTMDDVMLFNRVLSESEIRRVMNRQP